MPQYTYLAPAAAPVTWDRRWSSVYPVIPAADRVDGSAWLGPVRDQGREGSCSAQSGGGAVDWLYRRYRPVNHAGWETSAAFLYQIEREMVGQLAQDAGARLRQTQAALQLVGVVPEADDPYTPQDFVVPVTDALLATAAAHRIGEGLWCPSGDEVRAALDAGWIVQLGIIVTQSFESAEVARTGQVPMPPPRDPVLGGHAVLCYGYDVPRQVWLCRNSWSAGWGSPPGNFTLPWGYLADSSLFLSARAYRL